MPVLGTFVILLLVVTGVGEDQTFSVFIEREYPWESVFTNAVQVDQDLYAVSFGMVMEDLAVEFFDGTGNPVGSFMPHGQARALEGGGWLIPDCSGGCYMVSCSYSRATGVNSDIALFHINPDLELDSQVIMGEDSDEVHTLFGAAAAPGGCVSVLGGTGYAGLNSYLRTCDSLGNVLWEYSWNEEHGFLPMGVAGVDDGVMLFMASTLGDSSSVSFFDESGEKDWSLNLPVECCPGPCDATGMDSGYGVAYCTSDEQGRGVSTLVISPGGTMLDSGHFHTDILVNDLMIEPDFKLVVAGSRGFDGVNRGVMEACDLQGNRVWTRILDGLGEDGFTAVNTGIDGGYVLTGYTIDESVPSGGFLMRTGENGVLQQGSGLVEIPMLQVSD